MKNDSDVKIDYVELLKRLGRLEISLEKSLGNVFLKWLLFLHQKPLEAQHLNCYRPCFSYKFGFFCLFIGICGFLFATMFVDADIYLNTSILFMLVSSFLFLKYHCEKKVCNKLETDLREDVLLLLALQDFKEDDNIAKKLLPLARNEGTAAEYINGLNALWDYLTEKVEDEAQVVNYQKKLCEKYNVPSETSYDSQQKIIKEINNKVLTKTRKKFKFFYGFSKMLMPHELSNKDKMIYFVSIWGTFAFFHVATMLVFSLSAFVSVFPSILFAFLLFFVLISKIERSLEKDLYLERDGFKKLIPDFCDSNHFRETSDWNKFQMLHSLDLLLDDEFKKRLLIREYNSIRSIRLKRSKNKLSPKDEIKELMSNV